MQSQQARIAASNSTTAISLSSARTTHRFPSPLWASAIQIVRSSRSTAETQPQLQPCFLRRSAMISQYFTWRILPLSLSTWQQQNHVHGRNDARDVIEAHEHAGEFKECSPAAPAAANLSCATSGEFHLVSAIKVRCAPYTFSRGLSLRKRYVVRTRKSQAHACGVELSCWGARCSAYWQIS
jgi:hypothetical protein